MPAPLRWTLALVATLLIPVLLWIALFRFDGLDDASLAMPLVFGVLAVDILLFWLALGPALGGMDRIGVAIVLPVLVMMITWALMRGHVEERIAAAQAAAPAEPLRVGGDRDAHGCIGSAGYGWCARENACVRPWELAEARGFELSPAEFQQYCDSRP